MSGLSDLKKLVDPEFPRILERIKEEIESRERDFVRKGKESADSFLWEHSLHVARYTHIICLVERVDPLIPVIAALLHDIGKFDAGLYHSGTIPEEKQSSEIASKILCQEGIRPLDIERIVSALHCLYDESAKKNQLADILHDADFLAKGGYLGIANFFMASALKGLNLWRSLTFHLSKELTYACVLPQNMKTQAGKAMARVKSRDSLSFYRKFVRELSKAGIADFVITEKELPCPQEGRKKVKFFLAVPNNCPSCEGTLRNEFDFQQGLKCTELVARIRCANCAFCYQISFCVPEIFV